MAQWFAPVDCLSGFSRAAVSLRGYGFFCAGKAFSLRFGGRSRLTSLTDKGPPRGNRAQGWLELKT
jgi:hypothetical protein